MTPFTLILLGCTLALVFGSACAERRRRRELADALALLCLVSFVLAAVLSPTLLTR